MTYVNNAIAAQGTYPAQPHLTCPGAVRINLDVEGASVYYQLGDTWPAPQWRDEVLLTPGFRSLDQRADAVRVRRATFLPASVTLTAYPPNEIGGSGG